MSNTPRNSNGNNPATDANGDTRGKYGEGGYNDGMAVFSYIIGGIIVWSLIGWGLDNLLGTHWLVLAGALLGAGGGFYLSHMHNLTRPRKHDHGVTPQDRRAPTGRTRSEK